MRSTYRMVLLAILAAAVLAAIAVGCRRSAVAKVNGRRITWEEYYSRLERLPYRNPLSGQQMEAGAWVLQQLISEELILRLAEKEDVAPTEEQVDERVTNSLLQPGLANELKVLGITKERFKEMMRVEQAAFNVKTKGVQVTDQDVRSFFDKNKDSLFTEPESATVYALFVKNKADADKAVGLLDKGVEFDTVASTLSSALGAAPAGTKLKIARGDGRIPEAVQDIVLSTPKGKCTKPIASGDGSYVIFKVADRFPQKTQEFREVEYRIRQQLMVEKGVKKNPDIEEALSEFRDAASIDVSIERYKELLVPAESDKPKPEEPE